MAIETAVMKEAIRVLLVDDHPVIREGIRAMLSNNPGIEVTAEASSGTEAIEKVAEIAPHVILMDIRMPGMSGTEAVRQIKRTHPEISVIMLTMFDSEVQVVEAIRAGAEGYLTKDASRELLCQAVRTVVDGGTIVEAGLLPVAMRGLQPSSNDTPEGDAGSSLLSRLTPREMDVLRLLARGYNNKDICAELSLAEVTVKKHVQNVIGKLGVSSRTHASILGVRLGLGE